MTKGIIVIDMPESCSECPSFCGFYSDMNCRAMNNRTINYPYPDSFRQSWCPIESLPEKIDKIVKQLEGLPSKKHSVMRESKEVPEFFETVRVDEYIRLDKAIEIVKGGVSNETD